MLFDTHTHLNFKAFENNFDQVIKDSLKAGIRYINIVGTDIDSSKKAVEIAEKYVDTFASVGIHPHHIFNYLTSNVILSETKNLGPSSPKGPALQDDLQELEKLLKNPKVIAVGETGMDRHIYKKTRYKRYGISDKLINLQKKAFIAQIKLALKYQKSLIIHNRDAVNELLEVLTSHLGGVTKLRAVFHCCEPDQKLLDFAIKNKIYIGIDGDVTYDKKKQEFIKKIPLDLLVLETDSPFLTPEGLKNPNIPSNLNYIAEYIAEKLKIDIKKLKEVTLKNSKKLFKL
ncbi:TatD family hydrolase [Candidatus Daviesbacteria bacterium]|nr:TatD family hydrolase [Candidatus Daviesbacteria bacterium]